MPFLYIKEPIFLVSHGMWSKGGENICPTLPGAGSQQALSLASLLKNLQEGLIGNWGKQNLNK